MAITIHAPKSTAVNTYNPFKSSNPFKFSKFKYSRAVQFVSKMHQKLCKLNVSRTLYVLSSVYDSTVEREEKEIIHEKIKHCIIWVVVDIPL